MTTHPAPPLPALQVATMPTMSRSSSSSTITLVPSTPPSTKTFDPPTPIVALPLDLEPRAKPCTDLTAATISRPLKSLLSSSLSRLDRPLRIVGLLATSDSGCHMYADMTARACRSSGVEFERLDISPSPSPSSPRSATFDEVRAAITRLNADPALDGLIVYFPLFDAARDAHLRTLIGPRIDVEGVHPASLHRSSSLAPASPFDSSDIVYPCTALAVVRALQHPSTSLYAPDRPLGERFRGRTMTVINRSDTVGRPLAHMLANDGARVYSVDIGSVEVYERGSSCTTTITPYDTEAGDTEHVLETVLADSQAVISAVPGSSFRVPTTALLPGTVCVDLSEHGNFEADVREKAGVFAPRLGAVTILMLQLNALVLRRGA